MTAELARIGGPLGCAGLALLLVAPRRDLRLAGLAAWAAGALLLALHLAPSGNRYALAAAAALGALLAAALAAGFRRLPWAIGLAALACVPARIPVSVGETEASLLVPLYAVVAGAAVLLAWQLARGDARTRELGPLAWPLAAFVAWSGLTIAWTADLRQGAITLLFFILPFGLLAISFARLPWDVRWLDALYAQVIVMAMLFAGIGVYQWATREVFWNPKVIVANAYAPFYRVNSVFYDPSMYGRFLVVAIVAALVFVLRGGPRRFVLGAAAAIAAMWVGLLFSFSQSSFVALMIATVIAAAFAWRWRALAALGLAAAVVLSVGFSAGPIRNTLLERSSAGLHNATSGRTSLVANGIRIARDHPAGGVGLGAFKRAYADRLGLRGSDPKRAASHNTPVTVAAESGLPGLALLGWLGFAALGATFRRGGLRSATARACLVFGLGLSAIAVHSLFYNALFEDPMFWGLLGLAGLGVAARDREREAAA